MAKGKEVHFGQLAIVLGYVTPASVAECLKMQKMGREKGENKQLGQILVEQNARLALQFARRGYVLENGNLVLEGSSEELLDDPEVKKAYLGG